MFKHLSNVQELKAFESFQSMKKKKAILKNSRIIFTNNRYHFPTLIHMHVKPRSVTHLTTYYLFFLFKNCFILCFIYFFK